MIDRFKLRPDEIAKLTDRQIATLYFHPRDEHGTVFVPPMPRCDGDPDTLESELATLDKLVGAFKLKPEDVKMLRRKLRAKYKERDGQRNT